METTNNGLKDKRSSGKVWNDQVDQVGKWNIFQAFNYVDMVMIMDACNIAECCYGDLYWGVLL